MDWAGGPSYGLSRAAPGRPPTVRHYSLLPPTGTASGRGSVVTFDIGQPGVRRHSSPGTTFHVTMATLPGVAMATVVTVTLLSGATVVVIRRHSSPVMSNGGRRRSIVTADSSRLPSIGGSTTSALRSPFGPRRSTDDFRPLHFRFFAIWSFSTSGLSRPISGNAAAPSSR